mgnify:CR=1 FL=1
MIEICNLKKIILAESDDVDLNYICGITEIKSKFPKK